MHHDAPPGAARRTVAALTRHSLRTRRRWSFVAAVALFTGAASVPAYAADAAAPLTYEQAAWDGGCLPDVAMAPVATRPVAPGVSVDTWDGLQPDGMPVHLTVAALDLSRVRLVAQGQPLGRVTKLSRLAAQIPDALLLANGGYFDNRDGVGPTGHLPVGPEVVDGAVRTLPAGGAAYAGVDDRGRVRAGALRTSGQALVLPPGADDEVPLGRAALVHAAGHRSVPPAGPLEPAEVLPLVAVNPEQLPPAGVVALTADWAGEHPDGDWDVMVSEDRVVSTGAHLRLTPGAVLLTARGKAAAALRRIRVDQYVQVRLEAHDRRAVVRQALGRGDQVVTGGRITTGCDAVGEQVRPRTLLGWSADGSTAYLVSVSAGRRDVYSQYGRAGGATFRQTAAMLVRARIDDAVMLDGGGSSELMARSPGSSWQRLDLPDGAGERPVANGWAVLPR